MNRTAFLVLVPAVLVPAVLVQAVLVQAVLVQAVQAVPAVLVLVLALRPAS